MSTSTVDAKKVTVGQPKIGGSVFRAALGSTLPATAEATLDSAFAGMGYISEDGVVNTKTRETTEIKDWGGTVVLNPQTSKSDTFKMTFIEAMNTNVLEAVHGDDNVTGELATGITIHENAAELDRAAWVIDMILNDDCVKRIVIPDGKITDVGDVTYKSDTAVGYEVTITAYPYSAWDGDTHKEYIKKASSSGQSGASGTSN